jgi:hypothetical protein
VHPAAIAGATLSTACISGKFQGVTILRKEGSQKDEILSHIYSDTYPATPTGSLMIWAL